MAQSSRTLPLETLRNAIAEALWSSVSAGDLPAACVRLGLDEGTTEEAFHSKRKYVRVRLNNHKAPALMTLAHAVLEEYDVPSLQDFLSELTTHADHRITDLTRRSVLSTLDSIGELFGDLPVFDGLGVLAPNWQQASSISGRIGTTLRDDVQRHYVNDPDLSNAQLLEMCGVLTCSQQRFFDLVEKVVDPVCRRAESQSSLAKTLSGILGADGFTLVIIGETSRHPVYGVKRIAAGVAGAPKNLIFGAVNTKPDLYFTDAINNDIAIANASDALIYDRLLPESGLTWTAMASWWRDREHIEDIASARKYLFVRLRRAVRATKSPGENAIFETYYSQFAERLGEHLPALVPQVYLHYDPRTAVERGVNPVLPRQRMDLFMLLDRGVRVVLEVDGKHHYADDSVASPSKYAEMSAEDRRLRLLGYEVYRFGAAEFFDVETSEGRYTVGATSRTLIVNFFEKLFARHLDKR